MTPRQSAGTDAQIQVDETETMDRGLDRGAMTFQGDMTLDGSAGGHAKKPASEEARPKVSDAQDVVNGFDLCRSVFICFPGQEETVTREGVTRDEGRTLCDGPGCQAESLQADGWLFVGRGGESRHYCRACLVPHLEALRGQPVTGRL